MSRQSEHEGGKVVSAERWPPLPLRRYPLYSFLLEADMSEGHSGNGTLTKNIYDKYMLMYLQSFYKYGDDANI
jgi:hypothetical protein